MTDDLKAAGRRLADEGEYEKALILLKKVSAASPDDAEVWGQLGWVASQLGDLSQAKAFYLRAVDTDPEGSWAWRQLGRVYADLDQLDEAEKALCRARTLRPEDPWLWRHFAALHEKRKDPLKQAEALELIHLLNDATPNELNTIGIAYYNGGNYVKAVEFYRLSAATHQDPAYYFNMGLAFSKRELSQELDATDAYRRALLIDPGYKKATEQLKLIARALIPLASRARTAAQNLIRPEECFQFYLNPFEALQIDAAALHEDGGATVRRAKRRLLAEIDLEGAIAWLDGYRLDQSRALAFEDDLHDPAKRDYHWAIFQDRRLLRFLTRGDIGLFLYSEDEFPHALLELLEREPAFLSFLSAPFARQYNLLLTRAIECGAIDAVQALFDGRRWVLPQDDDLCFEGAFRRVSDLVDLLAKKTDEGQNKKMSVTELEVFLGERSLLALLNLLPMAFRPLQERAVTAVRSLAVTINNMYGDAETAREVRAGSGK